MKILRSQTALEFDSQARGFKKSLAPDALQRAKTNSYLKGWRSKHVEKTRDAGRRSMSKFRKTKKITPGQGQLSLPNCA